MTAAHCVDKSQISHRKRLPDSEGENCFATTSSEKFDYSGSNWVVAGLHHKNKPPGSVGYGGEVFNPYRVRRV